MILKFRNYTLPDGREVIPFEDAHLGVRLCKAIAGGPDRQGLIPVVNVYILEEDLKASSLVPLGKEVFRFRDIPGD